MTGNYSVWEGVIAPALYLPVTPLADLQNPSPRYPQGMGWAKARFSQWLWKKSPFLCLQMDALVSRGCRKKCMGEKPDRAILHYFKRD